MDYKFTIYLLGVCLENLSANLICLELHQLLECKEKLKLLIYVWAYFLFVLS